MNLNFYNPNNNGTLQDLQSSLQEQINKLNELKNMSFNKVQTPLQEQRYLVDCGKKEDWDEFLKFNYNLTETQIFEDYKLFLQAKQEVTVDKDKEKLESMKQRLNRKENNVLQPVQSIQQSTQQSNQIQQPPVQSVNQPLSQPITQDIQGNVIAANTVNNSQPNIQGNNNQLNEITRNYKDKGNKYAR